jgi:hypothetical protein
MLPGNPQGLVVVLLAVVPGFVATVAWSRAKTWRGETSDLRTVLVSIVLSALVQLGMSPLTIGWLYPIRDDLDRHPGRVAVWALIAVVVLPMMLGVVAGGWTTFVQQRGAASGRFRRGVARLWPEAVLPSIWDWLFVGNRPHDSFLVVTFRDGSRIAGAFAEGSIAFTSPEHPGLFLVSEWEVDDDGNVVREVPGSSGIMVRDVDEIRSIRLLRGKNDVPSEGQKRAS